MLSAVTGPRYLPRTPQEIAARRQTAALRAQLESLASRIDSLEREQRIQLQRIAQIQTTLDAIDSRLPKPRRRSTS